MTWIGRFLSMDVPDVDSVEFLKLLASEYTRPPVATDGDGKMLRGIGARDNQIRQLYQELFGMKILVASLVFLLNESANWTWPHSL